MSTLIGLIGVFLLLAARYKCATAQKKLKQLHKAEIEQAKGCLRFNEIKTLRDDLTRLAVYVFFLVGSGAACVIWFIKTATE